MITTHNFIKNKKKYYDLILSDMNVKNVSKVLGHKNLQTTRKFLQDKVEQVFMKLITDLDKEFKQILKGQEVL